MSDAQRASVPQRSAFGWRAFIRPAVYWGGLVPAIWTFYLALTNQLGADPMRALEHTLGLWALRFLILALAITPLRRMGGPNLLRYRRAIGLLSFFYATLHLLVYLVLDQGLDLTAIGNDILKRPYITVGMLAFLILLPLAITSNNTMIRQLGASTWQKLHRWVYLAAVLSALHFLLVVKSWPAEPIIYCALVIMLLLFRLLPAKPKRRSAKIGPAVR